MRRHLKDLSLPLRLFPSSVEQTDRPVGSQNSSTRSIPAGHAGRVHPSGSRELGNKGPRDAMAKKRSSSILEQL